MCLARNPQKDSRHFKFAGEHGRFIIHGTPHPPPHPILITACEEVLVLGTCFPRHVPAFPFQTLLCAVGWMLTCMDYVMGFYDCWFPVGFSQWGGGRSWSSEGMGGCGYVLLDLFPSGC